MIKNYLNFNLKKLSWKRIFSLYMSNEKQIKNNIIMSINYINDNISKAKNNINSYITVLNISFSLIMHLCMIY